MVGVLEKHGRFLTASPFFERGRRINVDRPRNGRARVGDLVLVEPLGRGGGIRFAAARRRGPGDLYALNGDELVDVDLTRLLAVHREEGAAATITVVPLRSPFGVVDLEDTRVTGFREAPRLDQWVSCGIYVLGEEALARFPEHGDHESTTFPELAGEGRLHALRHEGVWLTVNTPKDLRMATDYLEDHPGWPEASRA